MRVKYRLLCLHQCHLTPSVQRWNTTCKFHLHNWWCLPTNFYRDSQPLWFDPVNLIPKVTLGKEQADHLLKRWSVFSSQSIIIGPELILKKERFFFIFIRFQNIWEWQTTITDNYHFTIQDWKRACSTKCTSIMPELSCQPSRTPINQYNDPATQRRKRDHSKAKTLSPTRQWYVAVSTITTLPRPLQNSYCHGLRHSRVQKSVSILRY